MNFDEQFRALHEYAVVQGVKIKSLHLRCIELRARVAEMRTGMGEQPIRLTELRASIARPSENIASRADSARTLLEGLTKFALISQSHYRRISGLEEHGTAQ